MIRVHYGQARIPSGIVTGFVTIRGQTIVHFLRLRTASGQRKGHVEKATAPAQILQEETMDPEPFGATERKDRTVKDIIRELEFDGSEPRPTTVYTFNRSGGWFTSHQLVADSVIATRCGRILQGADFTRNRPDVLHTSFSIFPCERCAKALGITYRQASDLAGNPRYGK